MPDYIKNPQEIYQRSFAMIAEEVDLDVFPVSSQPIAERVIHACGMVDIIDDLRISPDLAATVQKAFANGAPILIDAEMLRSAIIPRLLPDQTRIICKLNDAKAGNNQTRSAAAVELWQPYLEGAIVIIGNAPTALFRLLELIDAGVAKPAAIIAFPVGFVGAAESKTELHTNPRGIPYATLLGRRGGTAMAGAAINAITGMMQ